MKWLTRWFLDNPVAANLLMLMILAGGFLSLSTLRVESFPQIPPSQLVISVAYPGGTAQQVDQGITQRVEDAISSVPGISRISSQSSRGYAEIRVKKKVDADLDRLMENIRNRVDSITGFPASAERPQVARDAFTNLAAFVAIAGDISADALQQSAEKIENALKKHPNISQVTNLGKRKSLLIIEPYQEQLKRFGLGVDELSQRIRSESLEYRSGQLKTSKGKLILRGDGYADNLEALRNLPIINTADSTVMLSEIANIERRYEEDESIVRFQSEPAIALLVSSSSKDHLFRISEAIQEVLTKTQSSLPVNVTLDVMADMSPYIKGQLDILGTNAWQGLLIVVVLLGLFLNLKLAFWVAIGIPVSMGGALWLMGIPTLDYSINDITLFGMILALGILVDDAVVVGESIYEARQHVEDPKEAAWQGVESVTTATTFGILTTIAAFSPMLWIENELAKVLAGFSMVVILALAFSLVESKFILPTHLAFPKRPKKQNNIIVRVLVRIKKVFVSSLQWFIDHVYTPVLHFSLRNSLAVLILFLTFFVMAYGLLLNGQIKKAFFPEIPGRYLTAKVTMKQGVPVQLSVNNAAQLEVALEKVNINLQEEYKLTKPPIEKQIVSVDGAGEIELTAELSSEALRKLPGNTLLNAWNKTTGALEGSYSVSFSSADDIAGGSVLTLTASDRELARRAAIQLKKALSKESGVHDVYDDSQGGQRQLQFTLNDLGRQLGINKQRLATIVGGAYGGIEINRLLSKGEEVQIMLRFADPQRKTLKQALATPVSLPSGKTIPLGNITEIQYTREPEVLYRKNRDQVVSIYWRQDRAVMAPEKVLENLQLKVIPEIQRQYPGVIIKAAGEFEELSEVQSGFKKAMIITLLLIYALLAIPLKSYWQPFIIMSVIPFGFAGAIYGHGLMGLPVSILSMFGMMAMTGVVINDSLVLMTRFNHLCENGMNTKEALIEAGRSRFRAVFLTTVTTVCGLLPLLSETSEQAQYLKPAAVSLVFGELLATPITLLLIPVLLGLGRYRRENTISFDQHKSMTKHKVPA